MTATAGPCLETDVDVRSVDGGRPPQSEATVGDLVETRPLGVGELLVLHRLLESACLGNAQKKRVICFVFCFKK